MSRRVAIVVRSGEAAYEALRAAMGLGAAGLDVRVWAVNADVVAGQGRAVGALVALGRPVAIGGDLAAFVAESDVVEVWG